MTNIIDIYFDSVGSTATAPSKLWQWSKGQVVRINGLDLPTVYQVHFSNNPTLGTAEPVAVSGNMVSIPDIYLTTGEPVYMFIWLSDETSAETIRKGTIYVAKRSQPSGAYDPTAEQQTVIDGLIGSINTAVDTAEGYANSAQIYSGNAATSATEALNAKDAAQGYAEQASQTAQGVEILVNRAEDAADDAETAKQDVEQLKQAVEGFADDAESAKTDAETARGEAQGFAQTASAKASEASQSASQASQSATTATAQAQTATAKATEANQSAETATAKASEASASAATATTKASEASASASTATTAKNDAVTAKNAAVTAKTGAETARTGAETAAQSVSASAAQIATNTSDIADLKADLSQLEALTIETEEKTVTTEILDMVTWTSGYMGTNGSIGTATTLRYSEKIPVSKGDVFDLLPTNSDFRYVCAFSGDTVVSASGAQNVDTYIVPEGIDGIVITTYVATSSYAPTSIKYTTKEYTSKNTYEDDIAELTANVNAIGEAVTVEQYQEKTETDIIPTFSNGYMATNGNVNDTGSSSYFDHTQKIPVQAGDEVSAFRAENMLDMRFVCAFSGDTVVSASGWNNSGSVTASYVVPEGIDGVVVSVRDSYGINTIKVIHKESAKSAYVKPIPLGFMSERGNLSDGETMTLPYHNVKNENIYIFNANIGTFGKIKFSKESTFYVEVDGTNLYITNDATSYTIPHGISIVNNVTLMVRNETSANVSLVRVSSNGQEFNYTTAIRFIMDAGIPIIQSIGSELTECTFSWVSKNVNAPIWLFGDSYFSWYDNRWTYYLARDGYTKNCLLNGYAGEASASAYSALINLLAITTPKIVVWCMGMNDGDSATTVNSNWKQYYDKLINLSKKYGFEIVLYTVPTTPVINNKFKDAIVRDSGYRYIEADLAVRIDDSGNWIAGALNEGTTESPDNVHPTPMGAKIIYYRVISDFPEIMCNN